MTKILLKILLILSILIGVGLYTNYLMTGNSPKLVLQEPNMPDLDISKIAKSATDLISSNEEDPTNTKYLYKWHDAKGIIHYTSEKPAADIRVEVIKLSSDTNILPAASEAKTKQNIPDNQLPETVYSDDPSVNLYSPQGIEHLFEQANDVQNLMNEHYQQQ